MRVSRIQAEENRQTVINVASRLFREHGFDGIGLKDLMEGAGLTQGAFYKQFASKDDLAAQASRRALESASQPMVSRSRGQSAGPAWRGDRVLSQHGASRRKDGRLPGRCARLRCCQAGRRREGVIRSRDQGIPRDARSLGWRGRRRGARRQGHGHSLDDGRCGASSRGPSTTSGCRSSSCKRPPRAC